MLQVVNITTVYCNEQGVPLHENSLSEKAQKQWFLTFFVSFTLEQNQKIDFTPNNV